MKLKMHTPWKKSYDQPRQHIKSRDITLPTKVHLAKAMIFPVVMYGYESWTIRKAEHWRIWCFWTLVLVKSLKSPLDSTGLQPVHPKVNQSWIFIWRTDVEAETSILWPPDDVKNWLIGRDFDARKDWRWEEKGTTENEMVGWHHWLNGHEFESTPGVGDGQGGLACCSPLESQRVRHNWVTELTKLNHVSSCSRQLF